MSTYSDETYGDRIPVVLGNVADVADEDPFSLIYVVFSTFFALLTQDEQDRCIGNVAHKLTSEGAFVLEAYAPDFRRIEGGQTYGQTGSGWIRCFWKHPNWIRSASRSRPESCPG